MRTAYRSLALLIALGVVFQAAVIAFGVFESMDTDIALTGGPDQPIIGGTLHSIGGTGIIPILTLLLLICSFFAKVPRGTRLALLVLLAVAVQIFLGGLAFEVPSVGLLHGANAFMLLALALVAARAARPADTSAAQEVEEQVVSPTPG